MNQSQQYKYPLMEHGADHLQAANGRPLGEITTEAAAAGNLSGEDLQIDGKTLLAQAEIAHKAGYTQLASNLTRAAELTQVPNDELLRMYEMLRPGRSSQVELLALADSLAGEYGAMVTADFVREAASVYTERNLLSREPNG